MDYYYRTTTSFPRILGAFFDDSGYELVEKKDHKKKRLEQFKESLEEQIEYCEEAIVEKRKKLKEVKDELRGLD